jgi:hypothetical protein
MRPASPPLKLRMARWHSATVLEGLTKADVCLSGEEIANRKEFLWNAMLTEYDAKNLAAYLTTRGIEFSPEFLSFKRAWSRDEWNHYLGFRQIYSMLYDEPEDKIAERLEKDSGNFEPIAKFLDDEFKVCLVLAYDEIATFKSYLAEFPFYTALDIQVFHWFQRVTRDELNHFLNCMELIRCKHSKRISEIAGTIDLFIKWDIARHPYVRTFVLDHYWYSQRFLEHCGELISGYFSKGLRGVSFETQIETDDTEIIFRKYKYL